MSNILSFIVRVQRCALPHEHYSPASVPAPAARSQPSQPGANAQSQSDSLVCVAAGAMAAPGQQQQAPPRRGAAGRIPWETPATASRGQVRRRRRAWQPRPRGVFMLASEQRARVDGPQTCVMCTWPAAAPRHAPHAHAACWHRACRVPGSSLPLHTARLAPHRDRTHTLCAAPPHPLSPAPAAERQRR